MNTERYRKPWTDEEVEYLEKHFGIYSLPAIAKNLGRSIKAILTKKNRLGLGGAKSATQYITASELSIALGRSKNLVRTWIIKKGLPASRKVINLKQKYYRIDVKKFWKWAYEHPELMKWEAYEKNSLAYEPKWLKEATMNYMKTKVENKGKEWSKTEDCYLITYYKQGKKLKEISQMLKRTTTSVDARLNFLGVPRKRIMIDWKPIEIETLLKMRKDGKTYKQIAEKLGRTTKSVKRKGENLISKQQEASL